MKNKLKLQSVSAADENDLSILRIKKKPFDLLRLVRYVKFNWVLIALALAIAIVGVVVGSKIPDETSKLFDGDFSMDKLWKVIYRTLITTGLFVVEYFLTLFAQSKSTLSARKSVWNKLMNAKMAYYDANDPTTFLSTVTADAEMMGVGIVTTLVSLPAYIMNIILCAQIVSTYDSSLLLLVGVIMLMHLVYMAFIGQWIQRLSRDAQIRTGFFIGFLAERIRNFPMIKAFSTQAIERENGKDESRKIYDIGQKMAIAGAAQTAYASLTFVISTVVATIWGCALIRQGKISNYQFIGAYTYIIIINVVFMAIGLYWAIIKTFNGQAYRTARLCEAPQESDKYNVGCTEFTDGDITFSSVDFGYSRDKLVLNNVSFTIPQGKITALIGPSGSGKTTVVKLLEGLYSPSNGSITLGDQDIGDFNIQAWRRNLSYVVQDAGIFSGTLKECLCYGVDRAVTDEELAEVSVQTGLYEFIQSQPLGFSTPVAGWGSSLSGGQRQRVVIARALLRKSNILIFDEPTSALDPENANAISELIFKNFENKTVVIISHELNYIAKADNIVFLHNGVVEAEGTHEQLMTSCKAYAELVEEQSYQEVFE